MFTRLVGRVLDRQRIPNKERLERCVRTPENHRRLDRSVTEIEAHEVDVGVGEVVVQPVTNSSERYEGAEQRPCGLMLAIDQITDLDVWMIDVAVPVTRSLHRLAEGQEPADSASFHPG